VGFETGEKKRKKKGIKRFLRRLGVQPGADLTFFLIPGAVRGAKGRRKGAKEKGKKGGKGEETWRTASRLMLFPTLDSPTEAGGGTSGEKEKRGERKGGGRLRAYSFDPDLILFLLH